MPMMLIHSCIEHKAWMVALATHTQNGTKRIDCYKLFTLRVWTLPMQRPMAARLLEDENILQEQLRQEDLVGIYQRPI